MTFKNLASRPYSFYCNLLPYEGTGEEGAQPRPEVVQPNQQREYTMQVLRQMVPTTNEFDCKAWAYFSTVSLVGGECIHSAAVVVWGHFADYRGKVGWKKQANNAEI